MQNKEVLISNLKVMKKELDKAQEVVGTEYSKSLVSTKMEEITKEEFYYESILVNLLDAIDSIDVALGILDEFTPESLVKMSEKEGDDYKELSKNMKMFIVEKKLEENPMLGLISALHAISPIITKILEKKQQENK